MSDNDVSAMTGLFKEVYADGFETLIPEQDRLSRDIPFIEAEKREGNLYHQPVIVTNEHGWTLESDGTAFNLNDPIAALTKDAQVQGASFVLSAALSYDAMQKALKGKGEARTRAFTQAVGYVVKNMTRTASYVREMQMLYGHASASANVLASQGMGQIESVSGSSTTRAWVITAASWAPAIWAGAENMNIDVYNDGSTTQRNSNATVTITSIDFDNRTVNVSGNSTDLSAIVADDVIMFRGSMGNGFLGLVPFCKTSGTVFNISNSTYNLWKAGDYGAGSGVLSFAKIIVGMNRSAGLGLAGDTSFYCAIPGWADMNNDLAALRRYAAKAGGSVEQGAEDLTYYSHHGRITIKPHPLMKWGYALALQTEYVKRLGASDTTFTMPGMDGEIFFQLPTKAGIGLRCYWNQAVLPYMPTTVTLFRDIINSSNAS